MVYAVSDLHGCYGKFRKLLEMIRLTDDDTLAEMDVCNATESDYETADLVTMFRETAKQYADRPAVRLINSSDNIEQCGLSRTGRTEKNAELPPVHSEVDPAQHLYFH